MSDLDFQVFQVDLQTLTSIALEGSPENDSKSQEAKTGERLLKRFRPHFKAIQSFRRRITVTPLNFSATSTPPSSLEPMKRSLNAKRQVCLSSRSLFLKGNLLKRREMHRNESLRMATAKKWPQRP